MKIQKTLDKLLKEQAQCFKYIEDWKRRDYWFGADNCDHAPGAYEMHISSRDNAYARIAEIESQIKLLKSLQEENLEN